VFHVSVLIGSGRSIIRRNCAVSSISAQYQIVVFYRGILLDFWQNSRKQSDLHLCNTLSKLGNSSAFSISKIYLVQERSATCKNIKVYIILTFSTFLVVIKTNPICSTRTIKWGRSQNLSSLKFLGFHQGFNRVDISRVGNPIYYINGSLPWYRKLTLIWHSYLDQAFQSFCWSELPLSRPLQFLEQWMKQAICKFFGRRQIGIAPVNPTFFDLTTVSPNHNHFRKIRGGTVNEMVKFGVCPPAIVISFGGVSNKTHLTRMVSWCRHDWKVTINIRNCKPLWVPLTWTNAPGMASSLRHHRTLLLVGLCPKLVDA